MIQDLLHTMQCRLWIWLNNIRGGDKAAFWLWPLVHRRALLGGKKFYCTSSVYACVTAAVAVQRKDAWEKIYRLEYWGETGEIELEACGAALDALEAVDLSLPVSAYLRQLNSAFLVLIEQYRNNNILDPDGYGLGTLHAIHQVFDQP